MGTMGPAVHRNHAPTPLPHGTITTILTAPLSALRRTAPNDTLQPGNRSIDPDRRAMPQHPTAPGPITRSGLIGPLAGA